LLILGVLSLLYVRTAIVVHNRLLWLGLNKPDYHQYESSQDKESAKTEYPDCEDADDDHYHADDYGVGVQSTAETQMNVPRYGCYAGIALRGCVWNRGILQSF